MSPKSLIGTVVHVCSFFVPSLLPLSFFLFAGCGGGPTGAPSDPTYWRDVAPILNAKCVGCHQEGGIGPFRLTDYASAEANGAAALAMVQQGLMPPYLVDHDDTCGRFEDAETVTEVEKQTLANWVAGGRLEGTPVTLTIPPRTHLTEGVDLATPDFAPVAQGGALAAHDEYRCFLLDSGLDQDAFVTGYEVTPGNAAIVHHVLAFVVDPAGRAGGGMTNAQVVAALDAESPDRDGWPCFGGAGEGVNADQVPVTWGPGQGVVSYPSGTGARMRRDHQVVVQIHYNLSDPATVGMRDRTTVRVRFADTVQRQVVFLLPDPFLDSLGDAQPASLPPGQASAVYTWSLSGAELGLGGGIDYADIVGVMPHMHERGHRMELRVAPSATAAGACSMRVRNWDFHWQKMYAYEERPRLTAASQVSLTCDYDTRRDTEPVMPGWGTQNEMCLTVIMAALPPGVGL
jgi:hypothetical protein